MSSVITIHSENYQEVASYWNEDKSGGGSERGSEVSKSAPDKSDASHNKKFSAINTI